MITERLTNQDFRKKLARATSTFSERRSIERTSEAEQTPLKYFDYETKRALEQAGYKVYEIGTSVAKMRREGRNFSVEWHANEPSFENSRSIRGHVAFDPRQPILKGSEEEGFKGNETRVQRYSDEIATVFPSAKAIIGEAVDVIAIFYKHRDTTGEELFTTDNGPSITRTRSILPPETEYESAHNENGRFTRHVEVGAAHSGYLHVKDGRVFHNHPNVHVGVFAIIVPQ